VLANFDNEDFPDIDLNQQNKIGVFEIRVFNGFLNET